KPSQRLEPLFYFHRAGPLGQIFAAYASANPWGEVGIIGLGTGSIASYAKPGQHFTFYEIDPMMEQVARERGYFTYLEYCPAKVKVVLGDARLSLQAAPPAQYNLFILDAFSSDAIPLHLVTREALGLYLSKLKNEGVLAFHISNRYLDLKPVLANLAQDAGLACLVQDDRDLTAAGDFKVGSIWVVMARQPQILAPLAADHRWQPLPGNGAPMWTDDFSNILTVFNWHRIDLQQNLKSVSE
ncbi:MAG: fused MFS/spermidine synthase, partial [Deltaproteobacteria bacterium]|nr:fused MFS/spermidine synthase [Deltaproteobacteria bacterium]